MQAVEAVLASGSDAEVLAVLEEVEYEVRPCSCLLTCPSRPLPLRLLPQLRWV